MTTATQLPLLSAKPAKKPPKPVRPLVTLPSAALKAAHVALVEAQQARDPERMEAAHRALIRVELAELRAKEGKRR